MWTALSLFAEKEGPGAWCKVELASFLEAFRALGERNLPPEDIPNIVIQQLYEEFGFVKQSADTETLQHVFQEQVRRRLKLGEEESEVPAQLKEQERAWTKLETDLAKLWTSATRKQGPCLKWWLSKLQEHKHELKRQAEENAMMGAEEEERKVWLEKEAQETVTLLEQKRAQESLATSEGTSGTAQGIACVCVVLSRCPGRTCGSPGESRFCFVVFWCVVFVLSIVV